MHQNFNQDVFVVLTIWYIWFFFLLVIEYCCIYLHVCRSTCCVDIVTLDIVTMHKYLLNIAIEWTFVLWLCEWERLKQELSDYFFIFIFFFISSTRNSSAGQSVVPWNHLWYHHLNHCHHLDHLHAVPQCL